MTGGGPPSTASGLDRLRDRLERSPRELAVAAGVVLVLASAIHLDRYPELAAADREQVVLPALPGGASEPAAAPVPGQVGPGPGADPAAYAGQRRAALAAATDAVDVAVVSLDPRRTPDQAVGLLPEGLEVHRVLFRLVGVGVSANASPVPPSDPVGPAAAALDAALSLVQQEADQLRLLLDSGTVDDPDFVQDYADRLALLDRATAAGRGAVHGLVVRGPISSLRELATRDGVRLVDPAPAGSDPRAIEAVALEPEQGAG